MRAVEALRRATVVALMVGAVGSAGGTAADPLDLRRDEVQAEALARRDAYLAAQRERAQVVVPMTRRDGTTVEHDGVMSRKKVSTQG
jgi:hypothetical protein